MKSANDELFEYYKDILEQYVSLGINVDLNDRWTKGTEHHPNSSELMNHLEALDVMYGGDFFFFKTGGDGDNGEHLMFLMDLFFELKDKKEEKKGGEG